VGAASLSALPVVTAGFYSKEAILLGAWSFPKVGPWLWTAGIVGALLTSLYVFRVVFLVFYGEKHTVARKESSLSMMVPLIVLSVFSLVVGGLDLPKTFGSISFLGDLMRTALPMVSPSPVGLNTEVVLQVVASLASLLGIFLAGLLYLRWPARTAVLAGSPVASLFRRFWSSGWGFDWLYRSVLSAPFVWIARLNKEDVIDLFYQDLAALADMGQGWLALSQTGRVRRYAMAIALGAAVFIALMVFS
jgi:NADH-quinone oxidoreductase subunit L